MSSQADPVSAVDSRLIRDRAMNLLARREHGRLELQRKLVQKGFNADSVATVLDELSHEGLVSDHRYAESLVHSRIARGQGPLKIRAELSQNGIADSLIDEVMSDQKVDWWARAAEVRQKKFSSKAADTYDEKSRQGRFLASRGFPSDIIWQVLGTSEH